MHQVALKEKKEKPWAWHFFPHVTGNANQKYFNSVHLATQLKNWNNLFVPFISVKHF